MLSVDYSSRSGVLQSKCASFFGRIEETNQNPFRVVVEKLDDATI
jgi:hypothetical protein